MAGIFGGLQSLHTDAYDEVLSTPTVEAARIAVATQNILRDEAHLADVIDPLGGSYYVEALTDQMEEEIERVIAQIDAAGGHVRSRGFGVGANAHRRICARVPATDRERRAKVVGVNAFQVEEDASARASLERPTRSTSTSKSPRYQRFKAARSQDGVQRALDALARAANDATQNSYEKVVDAALAGVTHGEICTCLRREMGFGQPLCIV